MSSFSHIKFFQIQAVITPRTLPTLPYGNCGTERPDIEYRDGLIITGTLEALIDMLRPGVNKTYKFTFLLCARLYIKPHELLNKLCKKHFKNYDRLVSLKPGHIRKISGGIPFAYGLSTVIEHSMVTAITPFCGQHIWFCHGKFVPSTSADGTK